MNPDGLAIAECLRAEIVEYGGLLNSFSEQQRLLLAQDAEGVLRLSTEIEQQLPVLHQCRECREKLVAALAVSCGQPAAATLRSLLPQFDAVFQPMLEALIKEVNVLIHRLRRLHRHNQTLLTTAVSSRREMLRSLRPDAFAQTYSSAGRLSGASPAASLKASG